MGGKLGRRVGGRLVGVLGLGVLTPMMIGSAGSAEAASAGTWRAYLAPGPIGHSCTSRMSSLGSPVTQVTKLTARHRTKGGTDYQIVRTTGADGITNPPSTIAYVVTPDGTVKANLPVQSSSTLNINVSHSLILPSVQHILHHQTVTSTLTGVATPTNTAERQALDFPPTQHTMTLNFTVVTTGLGSKTVTVPAGTFAHAIGVKEALSISSPNAPVTALAALQQVFAIKATVWWAKGVGQITDTSTGGLTTDFGSTPLQLAGCSGLAAVKPAPPVTTTTTTIPSSSGSTGATAGTFGTTSTSTTE